MRLAAVSPFVDRRHGTERALAELLERLAAKHGCEIHLYAQRVEDLAIAKDGVSSAPGHGVIIWHKVPAIPGPHLLQFLAWLLLNSLWRAWDRAVRGLRFDLLLSPGINCADAELILVHALFGRLRELWREDANDAARSGFLRGVHRRAYYALLAGMERRIYEDPNVALAGVSQRTATLLCESFHRQDVRVIPNGVDTARFSPVARLARRSEARGRREIRETDFVLLLIGNDWRAKGLETILRAMSGIRDLPILLIVAGDDSPGYFQEAANSLGISERCRFEAPRQDVLDFYAAADLYVSPSREDSFGLPVAEAMACGLPVITSPFAGVSEGIQNGVDGFVLRDARDEKELAILLEQLFRNPEMRQRVGEAAANSARQWSWDSNAEALWRMIQDTVSKKRGTLLQTT